MQDCGVFVFAKRTEDQESMQGMVVCPLQKHGKPRVTARNAVDQVSKNPEILYENFQIKKAEDFAPVALFIHFQMNYRISRPRKMVVSL
jgi:hypothetical protein